MRPEPKAGEKYKHYKGNIYLVLGIGRLESDPNQRFVIYQSENDTEPWLRPIDDFVGMVEFEGEPLHRFTAI